jgi:lipopolysaccharide/colanic/teichoic acid biosynthesis glycosyltransferase
MANALLTYPAVLNYRLSDVDRSDLYKRGIDVAVSAVALVLLAPLFLLVAVVIKLTDGGPVFFVQRRVGKDGVLFPFLKFRSMVVNADALKSRIKAENVHGHDGITFKMKCDPRMTRVGWLIRKTSIDELPQLWNVLRGDMSLVGPRPAVPGEVARYDDRERGRLAVLPGLTCLWQVSGRSDLPFHRQVDLDLEYINSRGVWMDLKLMARTVPAVLSGRGAY